MLKSGNNSNNSEKPNYKKAVRIIVFFLLLAMLIAVIPLSRVSADGYTVAVVEDKRGSDFTDNEYVSGKLQELFELLPYSTNPYFTTYGNKTCYNSSCSKCNGKNVSKNHPNLKDAGVIDTYDSWSCFAFARYAFLYIFGCDPTELRFNYYGNTYAGDVLERVGRLVGSASYSDKKNIIGDYGKYNLNNFKELLESATPGDILQAKGSKYGNHSMVFLGAEDDGVYVLHNNMFKSNKDENGSSYRNNRVMISFISYGDFMATWNSIVTVYRAEEEIYKKVWVTPCAEHTYNAENEEKCTACGFEYKSVEDKDDAGEYSTVTSVTVYEKPYFSAPVEVSTTMQSVTVVSSEINSLGQKWYKTDDGRYIYGTYLKPANETPEKITQGGGTVNTLTNYLPVSLYAY